MPEEEYIKVNREAWNKRTSIHIQSAFYDMDAFKAGQTSLKDIELPLIGDVKGKKILHLQCHFGQDSISLSRLGAHVTGVDFSEEAIAAARELSLVENANCNFVCCDLYELKDHLKGEFDMVFTSYGTIGWLPDLDKWADVIAHFLKKGGKFVFVEFHPVFWMFDNDQSKVKYDYFNTTSIREFESGTYADKKSDLHQEYITWNHDLAEVIQSLLHHGMNIEDFREYDHSPYKIFEHALETEPGKFRLAHLDALIPLVYSIVARKN